MERLKFSYGTLRLNNGPKNASLMPVTYCFSLNDDTLIYLALNEQPLPMPALLRHKPALVSLCISAT